METIGEMKWEILTQRQRQRAMLGEADGDGLCEEER